MIFSLSHPDNSPALIIPSLLIRERSNKQITINNFNKKFSYPTVNAAGDWLNGKAPEPEGWAEAAGVLEFAPNVNTPDGLLFVKLKFVVLLPNWKTEPAIVKAEILH